MNDAIDSNWIAPLGPHVDAFEHELAAVAGADTRSRSRAAPPRCTSRWSCSASAPGDEVACSDFTFAASANPIVYAGATPVFVDADAATWTIDPALLDQALADRRAAGGRVRAVIAVDLYGQCCDYDAHPRGLRAPRRRPDPGRGRVARRDVSGRARRAARATLAAFSFNGNKIITTSGGGMLVSRDAATGSSTRASSRRRRASRAPHYEHTEIGFNYRLSNLLAAVGRAQLAVLPERVDAAPADPRPLPRAARRHARDLVHARGGVRRQSNCWLTCIVVDPDASGADRERDPPRARGRGHRGAAALEADAPAAGLRGAPAYGGEVVGAAVRARALPAERLGADGRRPATAWSRSCWLRGA